MAHKAGFRGPSPDVGKGTQFKPGRSGNPGGRPARMPYTDAYRKFADLPITELRVTEHDTVAEAAVKSMYRQAIQEGNVRSAIEIADRLDGRVPLRLATREGGEFVVNYISHIPMPDRSQKADDRTGSTLRSHRNGGGTVDGPGHAESPWNA